MIIANNFKGFETYDRFLNRKISMEDTQECVQVLKVRILNRSLKKPSSWAGHFYPLHLNKYDNHNLKINKILSAWFHSCDFATELKNFANKKSTNSKECDFLLKTKILQPKTSNSARGYYMNNKAKGPKKISKLDFIKSRTTDSPQKYEKMSWHKLYKVFPTKILVSDTKACLELLKVRTCNLILKKSPQTIHDWETLEKSIGTRNYILENPDLQLELKKWFASESFYKDFEAFKMNYQVDTHPSLNLKIRLNPLECDSKNHLRRVKIFIFESLFAKSEPKKELWVPDFLNDERFINFVSKNRYSKLVLKRINKWYNSSEFWADLQYYQKDTLLSSKEKGLELYKTFSKSDTSFEEESNASIDWFKPVKKDIAFIFQEDVTLEGEFLTQFKNQSNIKKLTQEEMEKEKNLFHKISNHHDMMNWLKNSPRLSNQILAWWFETLSKDNTSKLILSEDHHIMPKFMHNYGVSQTSIDSSTNLISLTPAMHNLIHAIRFLEFDYQQDYNVINRLHHNLRNGELIQKDLSETVRQILNHIDLFRESIRKGKFVNLPDAIQQTFTKEMIWWGVSNYRVKTVTIPGKTVANYYELICLLHNCFEPDEKPIIPNETQVTAVRKYLNGQRPTIGNLAWQLQNRNELMPEACQRSKLKYKNFTLWEYKKSASISRVLMPRVAYSRDLVKHLEHYQSFNFNSLDAESIKKLINKENVSRPVANWNLIGYYPDLTKL